MTCAMCKARGQTWQGDAPTCSFPNGGEFVSGGWNCATANAIRDICGAYEAGHPNTDFRFCDDQKYATINISEIEMDNGAYALWVTWYKNRGRTEAMWLLDAHETPRRPTEADCVAIIGALRVDQE